MKLASFFKERIRKLFLCRRVFIDMALRQFKEKYAGSKLGLWWAVVTPLLFAVSINFVFISVFNIQMPNYTLFVLSGMIPWFFFTNSLSEAAGSFLSNSSILRQTLVPREFIPMASVMASLLNFAMGLIFLLPFFIIANIKVLTIMPLLSVVILFHFIFIAGFALLLSVLNVFMRDLPHILSTLFMVWFWITPVFYSIDMAPASFLWVCFINPMTHFVVIYREILFQAKFPPLGNFFILGLLSLGFFLISYLIFILKEPELLKRI